MTDPTLLDDALDGVLFRFWVRAASFPFGFPAAVAEALKDCKTPDDYRRALSALAKRKGINLPAPPDVDPWIVTDAAGEVFRMLTIFGPVWTTDPTLAVRFATKASAEDVFAEDEDAWRVVRLSTVTGQDP